MTTRKVDPIEERDWASAPYVRVYQSIKDDPKFASVYGDDRALAGWVRLLLDADAAWPARLAVPSSLSRHARDVLTKAGILTIARGTYTLSGLAKERGGRALSSAERVRRWRDRRNGSANADVTAGNADVTASRDRAGASSSDSVSASLPTSSLAGAREELPPMTVVIDFLEERTRRQWHGRPGQQLWDTLEADLRDFGLEHLLAEYRKWPGERQDFGQIVYGVSKLLHPPAATRRPPTKAEIEAAEGERQLAALEARRPR